MLGPDESTIRGIVEAMQIGAGPFRDRRMLLVLTGTRTSLTQETLFVEEAPGQLGVTELPFGMAGDEVFAMMRAFDMGREVNIYPGMDRYGRGGRRVYLRYEGQIELFVSGDEFSIEVFHHDTIPEELLPEPLREYTHDEGIDHFLRRNILISERYFGPGQLIDTGYVTGAPWPPDEMQPWRVDMRTLENVPWPTPPGPPPWD